MNGTVVDAKTYDEAIYKIQTCNTKNYWATEEEPGKWCVLFEDGIEVNITGSHNSIEASKRAKEVMKNEDILVGVNPSLPYFEKPQKRCCSFVSYCFSH